MNNNINLDEIRQLANMIDVFANCLQQDVNQHCDERDKGHLLYSFPTGTPRRRGIWDYCSNNKITETAEPQPDGIQFRKVDDLGWICIPKDIRDKLGIEPGTECAVYATDELTPEEIIVIRRK